MTFLSFFFFFPQMQQHCLVTYTLTAHTCYQKVYSNLLYMLFRFNLKLFSFHPMCQRQSVDSTCRELLIPIIASLLCTGRFFFVSNNSYADICTHFALWLFFAWISHNWDVSRINFKDCCNVLHYWNMIMIIEKKSKKETIYLYLKLDVKYTKSDSMIGHLVTFWRQVFFLREVER